MDAIDTKMFRTQIKLMVNIIVVMFFSSVTWMVYNEAISGQREVSKVVLFLIPTIGYFFIGLAILNIYKNIKSLLEEYRKK